MIKMRRSRKTRRQQENDNQIIQAIKWWQRQVFRAMVFVGLPMVLLFAGFVWWIDTPSGRDFTGWTEFESRSEKRLESLEQEQQKTIDEFTESTNQDVQNTNDNIEGATEDTTGAEYYSEDPYTTPETQESVEQPSQETNGANNNVSEKAKKTVESYDTTNEAQAEAPQDNTPERVPDDSRYVDNDYLGPTRGQLDGYDEWDEEDQEKYYSWDEQTRQAYEESVYREE